MKNDGILWLYVACVVAMASTAAYACAYSAWSLFAICSVSCLCWAAFVRQRVGFLLDEARTEGFHRAAEIANKVLGPVDTRSGK